MADLESRASSIGQKTRRIFGCKCSILAVGLMGTALTVWGYWRVEKRISEYCSFESATVTRNNTFKNEFYSDKLNYEFKLTNATLSKRNYCYFRSWNEGDGGLDSIAEKSMEKWIDPFRSLFLLDLRQFNNESFSLNVTFSDVDQRLRQRVYESYALRARKLYSFEKRALLTFEISNRTMHRSLIGSIGLVTSTPISDFTHFYPKAADHIPLTIMPLSITLFSVFFMGYFVSVERKTLRKWNRRYEAFDNMTREASRCSSRRPTVFRQASQPEGAQTHLIVA